MGGYEMRVWHGIGAPAWTPSAATRILNAEINALIADRLVQDHFGNEGLELRGGTQADFAAFQRAERQRWAVLVKSLGLTANLAR